MNRISWWLPLRGASFRGPHLAQGIMYPPPSFLPIRCFLSVPSIGTATPCQCLTSVWGFLASHPESWGRWQTHIRNHLSRMSCWAQNRPSRLHRLPTAPGLSAGIQHLHYSVLVSSGCQIRRTKISLVTDSIQFLQEIGPKSILWKEDSGLQLAVISDFL